MGNGRHIRSIQELPPYTVLPLPVREQRADSEHRQFLQHYIDTAQGGLFDALEKEKTAMQMWREAELEKEIHGKALTAAQLRRADLSNTHAQGHRPDQRNLAFNDRRNALSPLDVKQYGVAVPRGSNKHARAGEVDRPAKSKKVRLQVVGIVRPKGAKNIWGQTAW